MKIIFLKEHDEYTKSRLHGKFNIEFIPVLKIEYNNINLSDINDKFIIVTSKNSMVNLDYLDSSNIIVTNGNRLYEYICKKFPNNKVIIAGNYASDIYEYIKQNNIIEKDFVYLRGEDISFEFKKNIPNLSEYIMYKSIIDDNAIEKLKIIAKDSILVVFSKKAARAIISINITYSKILAFSESIAKEFYDQAKENIYYTEPNIDNIIEFLNAYSKEF